MVLIVKILAILFIFYGGVIILRKGTLKEVIDWVKEHNRIYIASSIKAVIGILLMFSASKCNIPWIVMMIGALSALGGVLTFVIKDDVISDMVKWFAERAVRFEYAVGSIAIVLGVILVIAI